MHLLIDSLWRAAAYCLHPKAIFMSLLPLLLTAGVALGLGYFYWEPAVTGVRAWIDSWALATTFMDWAQGVGLPGLRTVLAPLLVVAVVTPLIVVSTLLVVAVMMAPAMLRLVADRRFPALERKHGGSFAGSAAGALGATLVAVLATIVSMPFWFVPPLVLVLPPLIWGWLAYRVMSYDVLAEHASRDERREILRQHRLPLLGIGILTGYLGAAPSLIWASGLLVVALAPLLVPLAIWVYTLVFAFSVLWFAHYELAALARLRAERAIAAAAIADVVPAPSTPSVQVGAPDVWMPPL